MRSWRRAIGAVLMLGVVAAAFGTNTPAAVGGPPGTPIEIDSWASGAVGTIFFTPDGQHIVYGNLSGLFAAPLEGGAPVPLGEPDYVGADELEVLPDSSGVVITNQIDPFGRHELLFLPLDGSAPTVLNRPLTDATASVWDFVVSPDGATVVYQGTHGAGEAPELVAVDLATGATTVLTGAGSEPQLTGKFFVFHFTPDSSTLVYESGDTADSLALFAVAVDGSSTPTRLTPVDHAVGQSVVTPDGTRVVHQAGPTASSDTDWWLYATPLNGDPAVLLTDVTTSLFEVTFDSQTVVYVEDQNAAQRDLYSVPISGGSPALLFDTNSPRTIEQISVSSDGARVLLVVWESSLQQVYSVETQGGSAPVELSAQTEIRDAQITPDGTTAVFVGVLPHPFTPYLGALAMPLGGGSAQRLTPDGIDGQHVIVSPDSSIAVATTDDASAPVVLYAAELGGGGQVEVFGTGQQLATVRATFSPDGTHVVVTQADWRRPFASIVALHVDPFPADALLRATTSPPLPAKITVDGVARDRWALTWLTLPPGFREICFGDVPGWTAPACTTVTTGAGTTAIEGVYEQRGWLRVTTDPPLPSAVSVDGVPRNQWGMWTDIAPGPHEVCFGATEGFDPPPCETVEIAAGAETTVNGVFTPSSAGGASGVGMLRVTTTPPVASQISVDGLERDRWSLNWLELTPGLHEVCFGDVSGWTTPDCEQVSVVADETVVVDGRFLENTWVRVTTSPAKPSTISVNGVPMNDWGAWVDLDDVNFEVCFSEVDGFRPECQFGGTLDRFIEFEGVWPS